MRTAREIYLTKRSRIHIEGDGGEPAGPSLAATFARNIESLGFVFSKDLFDRISQLTRDEVQALYKKTVPVLKEMVGAHRKFTPMYPNFPIQVMEASDLELFLNAFLHYTTAAISDFVGIPARYLPCYREDKREPLPDEEVTMRIINLGSQEDFNNIFTNLVGSNSSLSEIDKEIVAWFIKSSDKATSDLLPEAIPQKEAIAIVTAGLAENGREMGCMYPYLKTATDILRVAAVMSDGDVSLATDTKFRKWKRSERRFFLTALENCKSLTEDMLRRSEVWKRFAHGLHPFEYKVRYPKVCEAMDVVFGDKSFSTFSTKVEEGLKRGDLQTLVVPLLQQRPGDFASRLDQVLRKANSESLGDVAGRFLEVADEVSTPVLLQTFNHFKNRHRVVDRAFFPKGSVGKVQVTPNTLPHLDQEVCSALATGIRSVLVKRFKSLPSLGKVYVDESLAQAVVPFALRSASKSLRTMARGTRIDMPDAPVVRFFLWWKNGKGRTDIDLSCVFHDASWVRMGDVSYYNLRNTGCCHSGDITSAPNGACEFIDVDLKVVEARGVRYISMCLYSYTKQPYCELPECFAGWMARTRAQSGEVFEARTVLDKIDLTADTTVAIPVIFDVVERRVIWSDIALKSREAINNSQTNSDGVARMGKAILSLEYNKPNLYDLFMMHAQARGTMASRSEADTVFSMHEGITPYDIDKIMSDFMADATKVGVR